jgi:ABC-type hemin transport system substrate-binding protein
MSELAAAFPAAAIVRVDGQDLFWWGVRTPGALARLGDEIRSAPPPG